jgi:transcriptional regulator with XRE-family HTH domain
MRVLTMLFAATGITQARLAAEAGRGPALICDVMKGRRKRFSPEAAVAIANAANDMPEVRRLGIFIDKDDLIYPCDPLRSRFPEKRGRAAGVR